MPYDNHGKYITYCYILIYFKESSNQLEEHHETKDIEDKNGNNTTNAVEPHMSTDSPAITSPLSAADALSIKVDAEFKKFKEEDVANAPIYSVKVIPRKLRKAKTFGTFLYSY
jgi:phage terminase Nu1 subunit (DNA packaging protein)